MQQNKPKYYSYTRISQVQDRTEKKCKVTVMQTAIHAMLHAVDIRRSVITAM